MLPLIFLCALPYYTLVGYELRFNNFTDKTLIICSKKRAGIVERYYQIVKPNRSVTQAWHDANCLESLQWAELNPNFPLKGGLDLVDDNRGSQIPPDKQNLFDETFFSKKSGKGLYLWNNLRIVVVPNEIFQKTREAATKLVQGFDKIVCQTVDSLFLSVKDTVFASLEKTLALLENKLSAKIKEKADAINKELNTDLVDTNITELRNKIAEAKTKIENYIKNKINAATNKKTCFFNLAQIAVAAGKIHGMSICKNREFIIFDAGITDDLTGMPLLLAETVEGQ